MLWGMHGIALARQTQSTLYSGDLDSRLYVIHGPYLIVSEHLLVIARCFCHVASALFIGITDGPELRRCSAWT